MIRPLGYGPETLVENWPGPPVLILGPRGSGRRTWANYVMACHGAKMVWRSEDPPPLDRESPMYAEQAQARQEALNQMRARGLSHLPLSKADAVRIATEFFRTRSRVPRWVSIGLDGASFEAQNTLLKMLEELPAGERVILRATTDDVLRTIRSRCVNVWLRPGMLDDEVLLLAAAGLDTVDARELAAMRPGRPGSAVMLAGMLEARPKARSILSAAEARDGAAIALTLTEFDRDTRVWVAEWCAKAAAGGEVEFGRMAREAGRELLMRAEIAAKKTPSPRLAVRYAATLLATRPNK